MKRGDLVTIASPGDYGKLRPAVVVQSNSLPLIDSILVVPLTSTAMDAPLFRLPIEPGRRNGLRLSSAVMVEMITAVSRAKVGPVIGELEDTQLLALDRLLALVLGLGERDAGVT